MPDKFALHRAVIVRDLGEIDKLLAEGVDIDERDAAGIPPLHYAIHLAYADVVVHLLQKGISAIS